MTMPTSTVRPPAAMPDAAAAQRSYVEWGPIFAGAVVAAAISLALTTFGSALGLALSSPYPQSGFSGKAIAIAAALYAVWVLASAALAGGYLAGRLRHRTFDATPHESEVRNGSHGLVVWAVAALMVGVIGTIAAGSANRASWMTPTAGNSSDIVERNTDSLLRSDRGVPNDGLRRQVSPLLEKAAMGQTLGADERSFLARVTAAQTGATTADADKRVDATVTAVRDDVETARKLGILTAFVLAASMAISAAAAWFGGTLGGRHRDEETRVGLFGAY